MLLSVHLSRPSILPLIHFVKDGAEGIRTPDLFLAKEAFSQLNYGPRKIFDCRFKISDFPEPFFQSAIVNLKSAVLLWAFVDSNHRPSPYQRDALTN